MLNKSTNITTNITSENQTEPENSNLTIALITLFSGFAFVAIFLALIYLIMKSKEKARSLSSLNKAKILSTLSKLTIVDNRTRNQAAGSERENNEASRSRLFSQNNNAGNSVSLTQSDILNNRTQLNSTAKTLKKKTIMRENSRMKLRENSDISRNTVIFNQNNGNCLTENEEKTEFGLKNTTLSFSRVMTNQRSKREIDFGQFYGRFNDNKFLEFSKKLPDKKTSKKMKTVVSTKTISTNL